MVSDKFPVPVDTDADTGALHASLAKLYISDDMAAHGVTPNKDTTMTAACASLPGHTPQFLSLARDIEAQEHDRDGLADAVLALIRAYATAGPSDPAIHALRFAAGCAVNTRVAACMHVALHTLLAGLAEHALARHRLCPADARAWLGERVDHRVIEISGWTDRHRVASQWVTTVDAERVAAIMRGSVLDRSQAFEPFKTLKRKLTVNRRTGYGYTVQKHATLSRWVDWAHNLVPVTQLLKGVLCANLILAGGAVKKAVCGIPFGDSDLDLWFVGVHSAEVAQQLMANAIATIRANKPDVDWDVVQTQHVVTMEAKLSNTPKVQLVMRLYRGVEDVLLSFDHAPVKCAYDGTHLYAAESCLLAMHHGTAIGDPTKATTCKRALKQLVDGFDYLIPVEPDLAQVLLAVQRLTYEQQYMLVTSGNGSFTAVLAYAQRLLHLRDVKLRGDPMNFGEDGSYAYGTERDAATADTQRAPLLLMTFKKKCEYSGAEVLDNLRRTLNAGYWVINNPGMRMMSTQPHLDMQLVMHSRC